MTKVSKLFINDSINLVSIKLQAFSELNSIVVNQNIEYQLNQNNIKIIEEGLIKYDSDIEARMDSINHEENLRNMFDVFLFIFYIFCIITCFISYRKRWTKAILITYLLMLSSLPVIFLLEGYDANYFLIYSDLCEGVYGAMYQNENPLYNKGIGFLTNGFDSV